MGWGDALIDAGSGISGIANAFDKSRSDEEKRQLLIQQQKRQAIADALSARVTNAQLDNYATKNESDKLALSNEKGAQSALDAYAQAQAQKMQAVKDNALYGQKNLNGLGGDTAGSQPTKLIPSQQADVAAQANAKYPSLGNLAGNAVLNKPALNISDVQNAGYDVGPGRLPPESSPVAGSSSEARIAKTAQQMATANQRLGQSWLGMLSDVGGLKYLGNPSVAATAKEAQAQDATDMDKQNLASIKAKSASINDPALQNRIQSAVTSKDAADALNDYYKSTSDYGRQKDIEQMKIQGQKDIAGMKGKGATFSSDDIVDGSPSMDIVNALGTGRMTFDMMTKTYPGFSKNAAKREAVLEKTMEKYPDWSPTGNALNYKNAGNAKMVQTIMAANNALTNTQMMLELSDHWKRTDFPTVNKFLENAGYQLGDKNVSNIHQAVTAWGDEIAGVLGYGGASDLKTKLGIDLANMETGPEVFKNGVSLVNHMLQNKAKTAAAPMGSYGDNYTNQELGTRGEATPYSVSGEQSSGGKTASGFSVTAPNGKTYKFNNQNDLNAFKQKAGL